MMRTLTLLALLVAASLPSAHAEPDRCTCREGKACYHYLRAPMTPPDDPCSCTFCQEFPEKCPSKLPEGWNPACADNGKTECFLRRHAASWKISCSERLAGTCDCKVPHPELCPNCGKDGAAGDEEGMKIIARQLGIERRLFGARRKLILAKSPHFYLLTDIPRLKILTQERSPRLMQMHEIAHVFLQRAEIAYEEFVATFGDQVQLPRPTAIYLVQKESLKRDVATAYIGLPDPELYYGGDIASMPGRYPWNCCVISFQKYDSDHWLHFQMRHLIGHLLMSCWIRVGGNDRLLPRWVYSGVGHWLSRRHPGFEEMANFCSGEGVEVSHSGEKWQKKILSYATSRKTHPIQRIFDVNSLDGMDLEAHIRAWSWFDLFLAEDRERFVAFLAELRAEAEERPALAKTMGMTPEEFEQRWRDRVLGKRDSVAPTPAELDASDPTAPGAAARQGIREETDLATLASGTRSLESVEEPLTAATIVPHLASPSELVRESVILVLGRTHSEGVRRWLRTDGLDLHSGQVRAGIARILGDLKDPEAAGALTRLLSDANWLVRAYAARALGLLRHEPALAGVAGLLRDRVYKVRVVAMDALGEYGGEAGRFWSDVADELGSSPWQLRSAAAASLGAIGDWRAVNSLIDRMEIEEGRIRKDIREALKKITRDDLGNNPKHWREFWDRELARHPGGPPPSAQPVKPVDDEYGEVPTYYGMRVFSGSVAYVLDTSGSMAYRIRLDRKWLKRARREYAAEGSKYEVAAAEIAASMGSLDRRIGINLYFFRSVASRWKKHVVPASATNISSAISRVKAERPPADGQGGPGYQTNYVDAFRLVLGLQAGQTPSGSFANTPDTIFFLTDGKPTRGDITDPEILLAWFREQNRFARLYVNVVAIGRTDVDLEFLTALAKENGGRFVGVPEAED